MPKGAVSIEKAINQEAEARAEVLFNKRLRDMGIDPETVNDTDTLQLPTDITPAAKKSIADLLTTQGAYAKISKKNSTTGRRESMGYDIEFPIAGSLDAEITRVARERGWGSGDYYALFMQHGVRGWLANQTVTVPDPTPEEKALIQAAKPEQPKDPTTQGIENARAMAGLIKELTPPQSKVEDIGKSYVEAIKEGRQMATPDRGGMARIIKFRHLKMLWE